jgi:23S rRNA (uracil1939-C5)-methyltransferase
VAKATLSKLSIQLEILSVAPGGDGVAKLPDGRTVFLSHAAAGDRVRARLTEEHKTYARARIDAVLTPGPARVTPPCPVAGICGGCAWQHLDYQAQAAAKQGFLTESLRRIGKLAEPPVLPLWAAESPLGYRNKAQVPVTLMPDGSFGMGYYKEGSHNVVPLPEEGCRLVEPAVDAALRFARAELPSLGLGPYDQAKGTGTLRHVMARCNRKGETMLVIVTRTPLSERVRKQASAWITRLPGLLSVQNNIQDKTGNVVLGPQTITLIGPDQLEEDLGGLRFKLAASSFFQVNPSQTLKLWDALQASRPWKGTEKVLELYCGVGTLSLPMARLGVEVFGVESHGPAVDDARANAALNNLNSARFQVSDAEKAWADLPEGWTPDLVLVDPPRKGLDAIVINALAEHAVPELLYVSCDPASLARDTARLAEKGYILQQCQPVDLFPQTPHVESVNRFLKS